MSEGNLFPSWKSPQIEDLLSQLAGKDRQLTILTGKCMTCDGEAVEFRNPLSRKEYTISGMCQKCQDEVFGRD